MAFIEFTDTNINKIDLIGSMELKQVILVRQDLKLPKGKMGAQTAHAAVEAALKADKDVLKAWRSSGSKKVILKVRDKEELLRFLQHAKDNKIPSALITDAGRTVIAPGTMTCLAIGPAEEESIDRITGELGML